MEFDFSHPIFDLVSKVSGLTGVRAFVVGGYVRDEVLKRGSKDIDFVVLGNGIEFAEAVAAELPGTPQVIVYRNFGTAMIKTETHEFEFVGARKESYNRDSRKPVVSPGSLADDLARRDFTINAMAVELSPEEKGRLWDPYQGLADLEANLLRTPLDPAITFDDDPLRMMRAVRFAAQLNFDIEETTFKAIPAHVERLSIVSPERITEELNKLLLSPRPGLGLRLMQKSGLLDPVLPELAAMKGVEVRNNQAHKDNFFHTLQVLDQLCERSDDLWLRWAALLHDIGKPRTKRFAPTEGWTFHGHEDIGSRMVGKIFNRMRLPQNEKMKFVQKMVGMHHRPKALAEEGVTDSAIRRLIVDAGDDVDALFTLCWADITTRNETKLNRYRANLELVREKLIEVTEKDHLRNWQPPVTGEDIMACFGIGPSQQVGIIKTVIRESILDGVIPNQREAAMDLMLAEGKKLGLMPV